MAQKIDPTQSPILSCEQVRACDNIAIERYQIPSIVLMENAGAAAARYIISLLKTPETGQVGIIAGVGNNAGDGFVVARHLYNVGVTLRILICGSRERIKGDALVNLRIIENMDLAINYLNQQTSSDIAGVIKTQASCAEIIIDAMLGTGVAGAPREPIRSAIKAINELKTTVVALDTPSGLDCDTGEPLETAIRAQHTVTFAAMKKGFQAASAAQYTGHITVASIGINTALLQ